MPRRLRDGTAMALLVGALAVQGAHGVLLAVTHHGAIASNILQALAPLLCALLCLHKASACGSKYQKRLWLQVAATFFLWTAGQLLFLYALLFPVAHHPIPYSDIAWLVSAFPILLAASSMPLTSQRDQARWLDTAQSGLFFVLVFALLYSRAAVFTLSRAYNVQSVALLLALAIRYSMSERGLDRLFYRNLTVYMAIYATCSALGYGLWTQGLQMGSFVDLCWTLPFTSFVLVVFYRGSASAPFEQWSGRKVNIPRHLHGISALLLALMSLAGAAILAQRYPVPGGILLSIAFVLFASRTCAREWQLQAVHQKLQQSALHDSLTGLANRAMLEQELNARLKIANEEHGRSTALLFIDLDRFKTINDGLGHAFGDLLLLRVAGLLRQAVRSQDLVARQGGDEFVVLLDQVDAEQAEVLAQRVIDTLRAPLEIESRIIYVTASVGVVLSSPGATAHGMIQDADCAMYKAKGLGKDRAQIFAPKMLVAAKYRLALETDLRTALSQGTMDVHYQPIYAIPGKNIVGFEALSRWNHPERGVVSPAQFIPVAEDTRLIVELGRQVLRRACHQCQAWNQRFGTRLTVAVNVSALQFASPGLMDEIAASLRDSGLEPQLLKLEITESVLLSGYQVVEEMLTKARALGIAVCLDDFGTGYSSLSYLLRFPFDIIKVDRSFVRHLDRDHRRAEMVRMVIQLAATLKKKVVAEGVESVEELSYLNDFSCDMVQGFLFSKPLSPEGVTSLLEAGEMTLELSRTLKKGIARPLFLQPSADTLPARLS
ncbi:MAG TPA: EAL domain-containing protein [Acidobacteriaceae bacterium]